MTTKKYEIRFKDIDPDSGDISQDLLIAICVEENNAKWILHAIYQDWYSPNGPNDPNRDFYIADIY